jgi:hypothetical protein
MDNDISAPRPTKPFLRRPNTTKKAPGIYAIETGIAAFGHFRGILHSFHKSESHKGAGIFQLKRLQAIDSKASIRKSVH